MKPVYANPFEYGNERIYVVQSGLDIMNHDLELNRSFDTILGLGLKITCNFVSAGRGK